MANLNPIVQTTLSIAIPNVYPDRVDPQGTWITPASMTDVLAPGPNKSNRTMLLIDREVFEVIAITSTQAQAHRGVWGSIKAAHAANTPVWVGPESAFSAFYQEEISRSVGLYSRLAVDFETINPVALTNAATMTAAQMRGGMIVGTPTGAANYTTDTATNIINDFLSFCSPFIGQSYEFVIQNISAGANTITLAAGTGVTLSGGTVTIAQNAARRFKVVITNVVSPAVTIYQVS